MKILITGAAGFLGSHLAKRLLDEKHKVFGIDNFFRGNKENLPEHKNFQFYELDLLNLDKTKKVFAQIKPELVIHYAAINGTRYFYDIPFKVCDDNIRLTQNVLIASEISSVSKLIYASSSEVYGSEPETPTKETHDVVLKPESIRDSYASSKAIGEFLCNLWAKKFDVDCLILRPFNTYGPNMVNSKYGQVIPEFIKRALSNVEFTIAGSGKQTRSFCHVHDHTNIVKLLISKKAVGIYNIGFDEEIQIGELAKKIHFILEKKFQPIFEDEWENDTKWRVPCLIKLREIIGDYKYISLEKGLIELIRNESTSN